MRSRTASSSLAGAAAASPLLLLSSLLASLLFASLLLSPATFATAQSNSSAPTYTVSVLPTASYDAINATSLRYVEGSNDNIDLLPIGFTFFFYGIGYTQLQVSSNGDIQFNTQYASFSARRMPYLTSLVTPYLAYLYTDLYPMSDVAKSYATVGSYPARMFYLRLTNVPYATAEAAQVDAGVSLDVVFFESDFHIEVRYFRVDAWPQQTVNIGVEGPYTVTANATNVTADATIYANQEALTDTFRAQQLINRTVVFAYATTPTVDRLPVSTNGQSYVLNTTRPVPSAVTLLTSTSITLGDDAVSSALSIGFSFSFFGTAYSSLYVGSNGNIQFATQSTAYSGAAMPSGNSAQMPIIAFAFTDLNPTAGGTIVYGLSSTAVGSRVFVVRFNAIRYYGSTATTGDVTCDIMLHESSNYVRLRYYRLNTRTTAVLIGIQASASPRTDGTYDYITINNYVAITSTSTVNNTEYLFLPTVSAAAATMPTRVALTYTESYAAVAQWPAPVIGSAATDGSYVWPALSTSAPTTPASALLVRPPFGLRFFGTSYSVVAVGPSGTLSFGTAAPPTVGVAMPFQTSNALPLLAVAYSPTAIAAPVVGGVYVRTQTTGAFPNRLFVLRFESLRYAWNTSSGVSVDVQFAEATGVITLTYYRLDSAISADASTSGAVTNRSILIGVQASATRRTDYTFDFASPLNGGLVDAAAQRLLLNRSVVFAPTTALAAPTSAGTSLITLAPTSVGSLYAPTWSNTVVYPRATLTAPSSSAAPSGDEAIGTIPLGMSFVFYGTSYTSIVVQTNGYVQFSTSYSSYVPVALPTTTAMLPFIAPLWLDLNAAAGSIVYQLLGTAPFRYFVLRFDAVALYASSTTYVTFDVLLYETTNEVEIRYYDVSGVSGYAVLVGYQGTTSSQYGFLFNAAAPSASAALSLSYSTLRISPVAPSSSAPPAPSSSVVAASSSEAALSSSEVAASSSEVVAPSSSVVVAPSSSVAGAATTGSGPASSSVAGALASSSSVAAALLASSSVPAPFASSSAPRLSSSVVATLSSSVLPPSTSTVLPSSAPALVVSSSVPAPASSSVRPSSSVAVPSSSVAVLPSSAPALVASSSVPAPASSSVRPSSSAAVPQPSSSAAAAAPLPSSSAAAAPVPSSSAAEAPLVSSSAATVPSFTPDATPSSSAPFVVLVLPSSSASKVLVASSSPLDCGKNSTCLSTDASSSADSLSSGAIAGVVIGVVAAVLIVVAVCFAIRSRRTKSGGKGSKGQSLRGGDGGGPTATSSALTLVTDEEPGTGSSFSPAQSPHYGQMTESNEIELVVR